jgi:uncharacterized protein YaaR (DUF327 family)
MNKPLHTDSYHYKGYWVKQELHGKGVKARAVHIDKPGIYLEIVPQNSEGCDYKRVIKEFLSLLSESDKSHE